MPLAYDAVDRWVEMVPMAYAVAAFVMLPGVALFALIVRRDARSIPRRLLLTLLALIPVAPALAPSLVYEERQEQLPVQEREGASFLEILTVPAAVIGIALYRRTERQLGPLDNAD